ncbi:MAG: UvrD-helicase domain-containing protein [Anaerolineae bacterium]
MSDLHPIIAQMSPSPEQRPAITARGHDVVVTAGAGTGKTRTLVARYLSLLAEAVEEGQGQSSDLRSVVAITFTRKAAREMRNRVREEVRRYLDSGSITGSELDTWREVYTALDAARIGTIHSLCAEILRHHPAEAGIDPRFEMLDEGVMALLKAQVADEALGWAADEPFVAQLFALLGESGVRDVVEICLSQRLELSQIWSQVPSDPEALLAHWDALLARHRGERLEAFLTNEAVAQAIEMLAEAEPLDPADRMVRQRAAVLSALREFAGSDLKVGSISERLIACVEEGSATVSALEALDEINLVGGRQNAWPGGAEQREEVKSALRTLRELWRSAAPAITLTLNERDEARAEHDLAFRRLYDWVWERYEARKAERRALDFDDLEAGALGLLEAYPEVLDYWREEVRALLVDEFQDTNRRQAALLELLNQGRECLFVVGDAKQSIYRFRGADVEVFRNEAAKASHVYELSTSYRAHKDLVESLNALLAPVLGTEEDIRQPYIEPFAPLTPHREVAPEGMQPPYIEVHIALGTKQDGALQVAAQAVANRLVELVEKEKVLIEDREAGPGDRRAPNYGDVAILCRASTSFRAYEDALEASGIPFLTVAGRGFYERPEVRDALNALQAIADPTDDLALAGLLRSPAFGLTDIALYLLVKSAREGGTSLWGALSQDLVALGAERAPATRATELVRKLNALAGRVPVADVLKAFLDTTGYRAILRRAGQARAAHNLEKLLSDAHTSGIVGMSAFLAYVEELRDVGTREGEARVLSEGAVQLMTVHAAKGLEFPLVVIGDAARGTHGVRGPLISRTAGLVLPLKASPAEEDASNDDAEEISSAVYQLVKAQEEAQERAESDRLLYVAATRVKDMLWISGTARKSCRGWLERLGLALGLETVEADEGGSVDCITLDLEGYPVELRLYPEGCPLSPKRSLASQPSAVEAVKEWAGFVPDDLPMLRTFTPAPVRVDETLREEMRDPPKRVWRVVPELPQPRAPAWVVGQIVHGALERWLFPECDREFTAWAGSEASACGITDATELRDAVRRAETMLLHFQANTLYDRMDTSPRRLHEVPYSFRNEQGGIESGIVDALFETPHGWTLVEFKTDYVKDAHDLEELLVEKGYVTQVDRYLVAAEQLLGARPQPVLCFLNYRGTVRLLDNRW